MLVERLGPGEHAIDFNPEVGVHWLVSPDSRSRYSQAFATTQSFLTAAAEMPSTSEISSVDKPPKKRSSTTRDLRESKAARWSRASSSAAISRPCCTGTVRA